MNETNAAVNGLPEGWEHVSLGALSDVIRGITFPASVKEPEKSQNNICCLRTANIQSEIIWNDVYFVPREYLKRDDQVVKLGDILMSMANSYELVGKVAVVRHLPHETAFGAFLGAIRPKSSLNGQYLFHFLRTQFAQNSLRKSSSQTTNIANISVSTLNEIPVPVAPLPEQKRIADKLDRLLARVDACRERLDRVPALLKRFRQSVLAAATSGELTREWREAQQDMETAAEVVRKTPLPAGKETGRAAGVKSRSGRFALSVGPSDRVLPTGWEWVALSRIAKLESGHTPSRAHDSYWNGGIPWIGIKDARENHGGIIEETFQTVSAEGLENSAARLLPARTVCLSRTASVGYVTIMGKAMATSQDFANWVCTPALVPEYLMYALMAEGDGLRDFGEGSTHTTIYFPELKALHLALPPPREQAEIIRRTREMMQFADKLDVLYSSAQTGVAVLTPATLAKAFRGELVPQDPNDEPASALLTELKTEQARSAAAPSRRPKTPEKRPTMRNTDKDSIKTAILKQKADCFSFDELRAQVPSDYESLKTAVFELLEEPSPVIRQVFDKTTKTMQLVRVRQ